MHIKPQPFLILSAEIAGINMAIWGFPFTQNTIKINETTSLQLKQAVH